MKIIMKLVLLFLGTVVCLSAQDTGDFRAGILERHNLYRVSHRVNEVRWNTGLERHAIEWAKRLAREDKMYHRQPNRYGENIYWISGGIADPRSVVDAWYGEVKDYNFLKGDFTPGTGHFTQVVWSTTREIGCGFARSASGGVYVVCNYDPPGNVLGRFAENVFPSRK